MRSAARTGDLVFRAEDGPISRMVMRLQRDERYSHVGVVVVSGGQPRIFHAEMDAEAGVNGVVSQEFCVYLKRAVRATLMRPTALKEGERIAIADAVASLGHPSFNWRLLWQPGDGSVYCTQYVWRVFDLVAPGRLPGLPAEAVLTVPHLFNAIPLSAVPWRGP